MCIVYKCGTVDFMSQQPLEVGTGVDAVLT